MLTFALKEGDATSERLKHRVGCVPLLFTTCRMAVQGSAWRLKKESTMKALSGNPPRAITALLAFCDVFCTAPGSADLLLFSNYVLLTLCDSSHFTLRA